MLDLVTVYLTAERASCLLDDHGGRMYITARGEIPRPDEFPARVTIPVQIVDDPGPAIIG